MHRRTAHGGAIGVAPARVFFDEVQLVALMTSDAEGAERFVRQILGELAYAPRTFVRRSSHTWRTTAA